MKKIIFDLKELQEFLETFVDDNGTYGIYTDISSKYYQWVYSAHQGFFLKYIQGKIIEEEEKMVERKIVLKYEVTKGIKVILLNAMKDLAAGIPIKWDRVVEGDQRVSVYGWIPKDASPHFDFVMIYIDLIPGILNYVTSSVKYSKKMLVNWDGTDINHVDCITFDEFFRDVVDGQ